MLTIYDKNSRKNIKKLTITPGVSITAATLGLNNISFDEDKILTILH